MAKPPSLNAERKSPQVSITVQDTPFDAGALLNKFLADKPDCGAVASFTGTVRDIAGGKVTLNTLTLEHYPGMTERELERTAQDACTRFDLHSAHIIHRFGMMHVGEPIVMVLAASAHRHAAIHAVDFMMDFLKSRAPFWKKESLNTQSDHSSTATGWVDARDSDESALARWQKTDG